MDRNSLRLDTRTKVVMKLDIAMLGSWAKLVDTGHFDGTAVIFEDFAVDLSFRLGDSETVTLHFAEKLHERNDFAKGVR